MRIKCEHWNCENEATERRMDDELVWLGFDTCGRHDLPESHVVIDYSALSALTACPPTGVWGIGQRVIGLGDIGAAVLSVHRDRLDTFTGSDFTHQVLHFDTDIAASAAIQGF